MNLFLVRTTPGLLAVLLTAGVAVGQPYRPRPVNRPQPVGNRWPIQRPQPAVVRPPVRPPSRLPQPVAIPGNRLVKPFHRHLRSVRPGFIVIRGRHVGEDDLQGASEEGFQVVRDLVVSNQTGESLRVHVRFPGEDQVRSWNFEPGEKAALAVDGERIATDQAQIWAESPTQRWTRYRDDAIVAVPEPYQADEIGTWTHIFQ